MKSRALQRKKSSAVASRSSSRKVIVELPAALYVETEKATAKLSVTRSALIRAALRDYLEKRQRLELESELAAGYVANAEQAREIAADFDKVDSELP